VTSGSNEIFPPFSAGPTTGPGGREKVVLTPGTPEPGRRPAAADPSWSVVVGGPRPAGPAHRPGVLGPSLVCVFLLLGYVSCSAVLVSRIQAWSFFDAFYFCFLALLTVGPGNLSPSQASLPVCVLYIFIGLILVSTCWHIFHEEVVLKLRQGGAEGTQRRAGRGTS
jgi:hypothetical protein